MTAWRQQRALSDRYLGLKRDLDRFVTALADAVAHARSAGQFSAMTKIFLSGSFRAS
ncbi:hypothetical protein MES4922_210327 [Mesorhizobium ventifaucium]|uniref:Transposase n=1 Tax=Mesorhizobium ventifaucium TaxID=666020 RepID=A0ABM9DSB0_9HYPH|nr:hypothetical protein MES4922_210327 [Mesorhizobium ventifaucium]